jgi:hypothetical protein
MTTSGFVDLFKIGHLVGACRWCASQRSKSSGAEQADAIAELTCVRCKGGADARSFAFVGSNR